MWWLLAAVTYVLIGWLTARRVFVAYIDVHGRNAVRYKDRYGRSIGEAHDPLAMPFWTGMFWPIVLPIAGVAWLWVHTIEAPTAKERRDRKRQELERVAAEVRQIGDRYGLPVDGYVSDGQTKVEIRREPE